MPKKPQANKNRHYFSQAIVYSLISFIALSNFNSQHSVFTIPLMKNCLSFESFSFIRFQIAMCFTLNKERRKDILFLWWPEIPQDLHTIPKYLKLCAIEDDSTTITHIFFFFWKLCQAWTKLLKENRLKSKCGSVVYSYININMFLLQISSKLKL